MTAIALFSVINHYHINGLHLFWDTLYNLKGKISGWGVHWKKYDSIVSHHIIMKRFRGASTNEKLTRIECQVHCFWKKLFHSLFISVFVNCSSVFCKLYFSLDMFSSHFVSNWYVKSKIKTLLRVLSITVKIDIRWISANTEHINKDPPNECPGYDTKQSDGEVPAMLEFWGMQSTPSLTLLPGPLWPGVVAPDRALSMG